MVINKLTPNPGSLCRSYSDGQDVAQNYNAGLFTKLDHWNVFYIAYKASSKKDRTFAIKTLFYNVLITDPSK
jgi:hypothetical protein